jgi:DNA-binding transcriptional LysR family regulator
MDQIRQLEIFNAAIELGSVAAAGRALGLSPAMAGKYLSALESALGVRLVQRTTRSLSLTDAGTRYLPASRRILEALTEANAQARKGRNELAGLIRMSVPRAFGMLRLAPALATFCRLHPRVTLDVRTDERYANLVDDQLDIALRIGLLADSALHARPIGRIGMGLFCSPAMLNARERRDLVKIRQTPRLVFTAARSPGDWLIGDDTGAAQMIDGPVAMRSDDVSLLVRAAVSGIGILYAPVFAAEDPLAQGQLVRLLDDRRMTELDLQIVYANRTHQPARVRALIDHLAVELAGT